MMNTKHQTKTNFTDSRSISAVESLAEASVSRPSQAKQTPGPVPSKAAKAVSKPSTSGAGRPSSQAPSGRTVVAATDKSAKAQIPRSSKTGCTPNKGPQPSIRKDCAEESTGGESRQSRIAQRVLKRVSAIPEDRRSQKDRDSLAWATTVVKGRKPLPAVVKRQRSADEVSPPASKKPKRLEVSAQKSYSQVLAGQRVLAVIDRSDADGRIAPGKWRQVEVTATEAFDSLMDEFPGVPPVVRDSGWHHGRAKLLAFGDQRSIDLFRIALTRLGEVWPGAKLDLVEREDIPSRPRARFWIPATTDDSQAILLRIRRCNPEMDTQQWQIVRMEEPIEKRRLVTMLINQGSIRILEKGGGILSYGFGCIILRVYGKNDPQGSATGQMEPEEEALAISEPPEGEKILQGDETEGSDPQNPQSVRSDMSELADAVDLAYLDSSRGRGCRHHGG